MSNNPAPAANSGPQNRPEQTSSSPGSGEGVLAQILAQTSGTSGSGGELDPEDMAALQRVAEKWRGEPFVFEPVAVELVQAVLSRQFIRGSGSAKGVGALQTMSKQVATTLFDDPVSRQRLESLWQHLSEQVR